MFAHVCTTTYWNCRRSHFPRVDSMLPRGIRLHRFLHKFGTDGFHGFQRAAVGNFASSSPSGFATMTGNFGGTSSGRRQAVATVKTDVMSFDFVGVPRETLQGSLQACKPGQKERGCKNLFSCRILLVIWWYCRHG